MRKNEFFPSKPMLKQRKMHNVVGHGGKGWFFITPVGLEVCVASQYGNRLDHAFTISVAQLRRALEVIYGQE